MAGRGGEGSSRRGGGARRGVGVGVDAGMRRERGAGRDGAGWDGEEEEEEKVEGGLQRDAQRRNLGRGSGGPNPLVLERWKGRVVWDLFNSRGRLSCRFGIFFFPTPPLFPAPFPPFLAFPSG